VWELYEVVLFGSLEGSAVSGTVDRRTANALQWRALLCVDFEVGGCRQFAKLQVLGWPFFRIHASRVKSRVRRLPCAVLRALD
jgi:hypothetical protein